MSQYQPPYVPPNVMPYYGAPPNPLRHAKRASLTMFIIGPLMLVCGVCASLMPSVLSAMPADQSKPFFDQIQNSSHMPPSEMLSKMLVSGVFIVAIGAAFIIIGAIIRRGGRAPAIAGSVLTGLVLLNLIAGILASLAGFGGGGPAAIIMQLMMTAVFGWQMYLLIQAARASSTIKQAQQQYNAQYWQYQQHMQAYLQYGQQLQQPPAMGYPPMPGYPPPGQMPPPVIPPSGYPTSQGYAQAAPPPPAQPSPADPNVPPAS